MVVVPRHQIPAPNELPGESLQALQEETVVRPDIDKILVVPPDGIDVMPPDRHAERAGVDHFPPTVDSDRFPIRIHIEDFGRDERRWRESRDKTFHQFRCSVFHIVGGRQDDLAPRHTVADVERNPIVPGVGPVNAVVPHAELSADRRGLVGGRIVDDDRLERKRRTLIDDTLERARQVRRLVSRRHDH